MSSAQKAAKRKAPEKKTIADVLKTAKVGTAKKQKKATETKQQAEGKPTSTKKPTTTATPAANKPAGKKATVATTEKPAQGEDFVRGAVKKAPSAPRPELPQDNDMLFGVKPKKQKQVEKKKVEHKEEDPEKRIKAEANARYRPGPLKFSSISVGVRILGCVREIQESDLVLSLPCNMTACLSIREVSDQIAAEVDEYLDSNRVDNAGLPKLSEMFKVGQLLRTVVLHVAGKSEQGRNKKTLEVTMRPSIVNKGLTKAHLKPAMTLCGAVRSVEEKGYLIDIGLGEDGFLPFNLSGSESRLRVGTPLDVAVVAVGRVVSLTRTPESLVGSVIGSGAAEGKEDTSMESLQPGMLVKARFLSASHSGLQMRFLDVLSGVVDVQHLPQPLEPKQSVLDVFNESTANPAGYTARVIYVDPVFKHVRLSLKPALLAWQAPKRPAGMKVGDVVKNATVVSADATTGVTLKLADGTPAYASKGRVAAADLPRIARAFPVDGKVKCRVLGFQLLDGVVNVSVDPEVVKQTVFKTTDLVPGQSLEVKVDKVLPAGMLVRISPTLKGYVPSMHLNDSGQGGEKNFQVGDSVRVRVLSSKDEENRVSLTAKKTLQNKQMPIIASYEAATEGLVTYGVVVVIKDYGLLVSFFGGVLGLLPMATLRRQHVIHEEQSLTEAFSIGQLVQVRVFNSVPSRRKLSLSMAVSGGVTGLQVGQLVQGEVVGTGEEELRQQPQKEGAPEGGEEGEEPKAQTRTVKYLLVSVEGHKGTVGRLDSSHLSDHLQFADKLFDTYPVGSKLDSLVVLQMGSDGVTLSAKPSLVQAAGSKALPSSFDQVAEKALLIGYVKAVTEGEVFVGFLGSFKGRARKTEISAQFVVSAMDHFQVGQSVRARVLSLDKGKRFVNLSLKASSVLVSPAEEGRWLDSFLIDRARVEEQEIKGQEAKEVDWSLFPAGSLATCKVLGVKPFGVLGELSTDKAPGSTVMCLAVHPRHSSSGRVGEPLYGVGMERNCRVLDQERAKLIADVSFRSELVEKSPPAKLNLEVGSKVGAIIQLVKENYVVLSLPKHEEALGLSLAYTSNLRVASHVTYEMGMHVEAYVSGVVEGEPVRLVIDSTRKLKIQDQVQVKENKELFDRTLGHLRNLEQGLMVLAKIVSIRGPLAKVAFSNADHSITANVHISEFVELPEDPAELASVDPLARARELEGTLTKMRVLFVKRPTPEHGRIVDLSCRPSQLDPETPTPKLLRMNTLKPGRMVTAFVTDIEAEDGRAWVSVQRNISGKIEGLDFSQADVNQRIALNRAVRCVITGMGSGGLSLRLALDGESALKEGGAKLEGSRVTARVIQVAEGRGLKVRMESAEGHTIWGLIHITELSDDWAEQPLAAFKVGQTVSAVTLDELKEVEQGEQEGDEEESKEYVMHLSLRPSLLRGKRSARPEITSATSLSIGQPVKGYVKVTTKKGCWVSLSRTVEARVLLKNLAEGFVKDPIAEFPPGKLVSGHITGFEGGKPDMSLRPIPKGPKFEDLKLGSIVQGKVTSIQPFGIFIQLLDSQVSGLCHISNVSDTPVEDLSKHYSPGDLVRAKVLKLEPNQRRVSLGLKTSMVGEGELEGEEDFGQHLSEGEDEDEYYGEEEEGDEGEEGDEEEEEAADDDNRPLPVVNLEDDIPPLPVFSFAQTIAAPVAMEESDSDEEEEEEEEEEGEKVNAKTSRRAKASAKKRAESQLNKKEEELLDANRAPESAEEFKRLLASSPDSSFLWIKLMAFHIGITELDKAREVAEQALRTINFREQQEKWNVWIALMNLENLYGTPESLKKVFDRAKERTDPKKITLELCKMYEASEKFTLAKEAFEAALKQYGGAAKVWYNYALFFYRRKALDEARAILPRALERLVKRKHLKLIQRMAKAEFTFGTVERGRTIMEGVMSAYPKRVDLWSTYLDMEIKAGKLAKFPENSKASIRRLFERIVHLDLKPRQMKFCFKRYLSFEKDHGDSASQHHVKELAQSYVDKVVKAS